MNLLNSAWMRARYTHAAMTAAMIAIFLASSLTLSMLLCCVISLENILSAPDMYTFPATSGQCKYALALQSSRPIVVVNAPAGTGKTLLACHEAMRYGRIALTRPTVAADEDLGYLPGDSDTKLAPWTRPMFDVFERFMSSAQMNRVVRVEPLGFLRGRTFENTFILADEMQNSTKSQMQLLLTRLGPGCKLVVTGDLNQSDVGPDNGLADFLDRVHGLDLENVDVIEMDHSDIMRSDVVKEILSIYALERT